MYMMYMYWCTRTVTWFDCFRKCVLGAKWLRRTSGEEGHCVSIRTRTNHVATDRYKIRADAWAKMHVHRKPRSRYCSKRVVQTSSLYRPTPTYPAVAYMSMSPRYQIPLLVDRVWLNSYIQRTSTFMWCVSTNRYHKPNFV